MTATPPDWQLPPGVSRGVWEYLHSSTIAANYDASLADSSLFQCDVAFVQRHCPPPGRLVDLGCGTGRLLTALAPQGYDLLGVDLSPEMLKVARINVPSATLLEANLTDLTGLPPSQFDYAACLFSTLGMIAGEQHRLAVLQQTSRLLRPGGVFVLHVHNRWFNVWNPEGRRWLVRNLFAGWLGRTVPGDRPMPPHQGISGWTMHLFTRREVRRLLRTAGFEIREVMPVGLTQPGTLTRAKFLPWLRAYGYLIAAVRVG